MSSREVKKYLRELKDTGFVIEQTKSSHWKITHPNSKNIVFSSGSPSDHRALMNLKSDVRNKLCVGLTQ